MKFLENIFPHPVFQYTILLHTTHIGTYFLSFRLSCSLLFAFTQDLLLQHTRLFFKIPRVFSKSSYFTPTIFTRITLV
jgi:hypothetical protein